MPVTPTQLWKAWTQGRTGAAPRYVARALHADAASQQQHAAMGFHEGWNKALDQLVELARTL